MIWVVLHKIDCMDTYHGPYVGISWVGSEPPPEDMITSQTCLWAGTGEIDVDIDGPGFSLGEPPAKFTGEGIVTKTDPMWPYKED